MNSSADVIDRALWIFRESVCTFFTEIAFFILTDG